MCMITLDTDVTGRHTTQVKRVRRELLTTIHMPKAVDRFRPMRMYICYIHGYIQFTKNFRWV